MEWFLKDYVKPKTGVKADENSDLHHWNIKKYFERQCVCIDRYRQTDRQTDRQIDRYTLYLNKL